MDNFKYFVVASSDEPLSIDADLEELVIPVKAPTLISLSVFDDNDNIDNVTIEYTPEGSDELVTETITDVSIQPNINILYTCDHVFICVPSDLSTVVSLKGRLPQKLQSKYTISCEIVQIHSLFRHDLIKKPKSRFNRNRK